MSDTYNPSHPHEPEIPPALDPVERCLVCRLLVENTRLRETLELLLDRGGHAILLAMPKEPHGAKADAQRRYREAVKAALAALNPGEKP